MKKILLLTYTFPPLSTGGTPAVLNMCRYLPEHHWEVVVVTVEQPRGMITDPTLVGELPDNLKVTRVPHTEQNKTALPAQTRPKNGLDKLISFVAHNYILVPDRVITWKKQVVPVLREVITHEKPQAIVSFGPHHSLHLIALAAVKELQLPFVPYFGDLWLADSNVSWPSRLNRFVESLLERHVVSKASGILATTEGSTGYFVDRYGRLAPPTHVVENSYDPRRIVRADYPVPDKEHITAGWTGNFFGNQKPDELLAGLEMFFLRNPQSKLLVKMAGGTDLATRKRLERLPLRDRVLHVGHLPWAEVPAFQRSCDVLIGFLHPHKHSSLKNSSKTAEYLASGRSVLGIVPEGDMAERIRRFGRGYTVQPNAQDIALAFERIEYQWRTSGLRIPIDYTAIEERFSAVSVMKRLANFLNRIT